MADTWLSRIMEGYKRIVAVLGLLHAKIMITIDSARTKRKGTKLAILGPPESGKTVVHTFLATGYLVETYSPTLGAVTRRQETSRVQIEAAAELSENKPIRLYLSDRIDVSGHFNRWPDAWKNALSDAFLVLFLFDLHEFIIQASYRRTVVEGCKFAGGLIEHPDTKVVLVGTHCDLIDGWKLTRQSMVNMSGLFFDYPEASECRNYLASKTESRASIAFGSLKDEKSASELLYTIFEPDS